MNDIKKVEKKPMKPFDIPTMVQGIGYRMHYLEEEKPKNIEYKINLPESEPFNFLGFIIGP